MAPSELDMQKQPFLDRQGSTCLLLHLFPIKMPRSKYVLFTGKRLFFTFLSTFVAFLINPYCLTLSSAFRTAAGREYEPVRTNQSTSFGLRNAAHDGTVS
jgi:hypothetical protein